MDKSEQMGEFEATLDKIGYKINEVFKEDIKRQTGEEPIVGTMQVEYTMHLKVRKMESAPFWYNPSTGQILPIDTILRYLTQSGLISSIIFDGNNYIINDEFKSPDESIKQYAENLEGEVEGNEVKVNADKFDRLIGYYVEDQMYESFNFTWVDLNDEQVQANLRIKDQIETFIAENEKKIKDGMVIIDG